MPLPKWELALDRLTPDEREQVRCRMRRTIYAPRQALFLQGEASDSLIVLRGGRVRLYAGNESGAEFTLGVMDSGRILGLAAAILGKPRILSAEAIDMVEADVFPIAELRQCMADLPQFSQNVMTVLATLAAESLGAMVPLALDSAVVRLATILLTLSAPSPDDAAGACLQVRGLTHEDLGKMVGATRTWVSLTLGALERDGLITKSKGAITVRDRERLAQYIDTRRHHFPPLKENLAV